MAEHHRKVRKESRKAKKNGIAQRQTNKVTKIPNSFPDKRQIMEEAELLKKIEQIEKQRKEIEGTFVQEDKANVIEGSYSTELINTEAVDKSRSQHLKDLNTLIENSDIILMCLDARDPQAYRSQNIEKNAKAANKKLVYVLMKCDLVTNADKWEKTLRRGFPCVRFNPNEIENSINEIDAMIASLEVGVQVREDCKSACVVGYPNMGKSVLLFQLRKRLRTCLRSRAVWFCNEVC